MHRTPPSGAAVVRRAQDASRAGTIRRTENGAGAGTIVAESARREQVDALLADLGSQLRLGGGIHEPATRCPTGVIEVDRLLGGGFPIGALCEISGRASSGRTSLALTLLARATRAGELAGLVDAADAFDPISAERAGVDLDRVLWVRPRTWQEALRSSERLIQTEGFPLVLFDWTARPVREPTGRVPAAAWIRLTRLAASTRTAVLLLSADRLAGSHAEVALEMQLARAHFTETPALLEQIETRVVLVRHRARPTGRTTTFCLGIPHFHPAAPRSRPAAPRFRPEFPGLHPDIPPDPPIRDSGSDSRSTADSRPATDFRPTTDSRPTADSRPATADFLPTTIGHHESAA